MLRGYPSPLSSYLTLLDLPFHIDAFIFIFTTFCFLILSCSKAYISCKHEDDKIVVFERAGLVFIFNFHTSKSFSDYRIGCDEPGKYPLFEVFCCCTTSDQRLKRDSHYENMTLKIMLKNKSNTENCDNNRYE